MKESRYLNRHSLNRHMLAATPRMTQSYIAWALKGHYLMSNEYNLRIYCNPHPYVITSRNQHVQHGHTVINRARSER